MVIYVVNGVYLYNTVIHTNTQYQVQFRFQSKLIKDTSTCKLQGMKPSEPQLPNMVLYGRTYRGVSQTKLFMPRRAVDERSKSNARFISAMLDGCTGSVMKRSDWVQKCRAGWGWFFWLHTARRNRNYCDQFFQHRKSYVWIMKKILVIFQVNS